MMGYGKKKKMKYEDGGMVFKPCPGCPTPAKCKAAGRCLAKEGKKGGGSRMASSGPMMPASRSAKVS